MEPEEEGQENAFFGNEIIKYPIEFSLFKRPDIVKLKENLSSSVHLESSL